MSGRPDIRYISSVFLALVLFLVMSSVPNIRPKIVFLVSSGLFLVAFLVSDLSLVVFLVFDLSLVMFLVYPDIRLFLFLFMSGGIGANSPAVSGLWYPVTS